MTPEDQQRLKAHLKGVAEILYRNTDSTELSNFESIEKSLRQKMLKEVEPELGRFFFSKVSGIKTGRQRTVKSLVGLLNITDNQAKYFGQKPYNQRASNDGKVCSDNQRH